VAQAVDGRVAQRDERDGAVDFIKGGHCGASFLGWEFRF
jgi:hypothetical protein